MTIFERAAKLNLPLGEYVIVGGTIEAHGIRPAHDIDVVVTPELFNKLKQDASWEQKNFNNPLAPDRIILHKEDTEILPDYCWPGKIDFETEEIIRNAKIIQGYPFLQIETLLLWKKAADRPKDKQDVILIEEYLKQNG